MRQKCRTKGCTNRRSDGMFIGSYCIPCSNWNKYLSITAINSKAFLNDRTVTIGFINGIIDNLKNLAERKFPSLRKTNKGGVKLPNE